MTSLAGHPLVRVVVGAAGGIGAAAAAALASRGQFVVGIDRHSLEQAREVGVLAGEHPASMTGRYEHVTAVTGQHLVVDAGQTARWR